MKKIITIMFAVILSCSSIIVAYADETPTSSTHTDSNGNTTGGGGGSFDSEQIYYDEIKGGTQTIHIKGKDYTVTENDKGEYTFSDGVNSTTVGDSETLSQLQGALKKGGTIETYNTEASVFTSILGAFIPTASKWGGALWNALNAVGDTKIKGTVNTDKTSDNYGAVTYDSAAVKQIYDLLKKQYLDSMHMKEFVPYDGFDRYDSNISSLYNVYNNYYRNWTNSEEIYIAYMRNAIGALTDNGYDLIIASQVNKTKPFLFAACTDDYDYLAWTSDGYVKAFDSDCNVVDSQFVKIDLFDFFANYDTTQNAFDYAEKISAFPYGNVAELYPDDRLYYFDSIVHMIDYVNGDTAGAYITSDFSRGTLPSSITLTPDMLAQDWDKFTDELADAITEAIKGLDRSEKQDKIDETFQRYLKKINSNIEDLNADNNKLTKKSNKLLDDILDKVKDINKDTNKYLKGIQKDYLKDIKSYCKDMKKSMSDILKNVKTIKHIEELNLLITTLSAGDKDKVIVDIKEDTKEMRRTLNSKFPTCVFSDAKQIYDLLIAEPSAPVITMQVGFESIGVSDFLTIDFHVFDDYIGAFRQMQLLGYIFVLFNATRKMFIDGGDV